MFYNIIRPLLFSLEPERAHALSLKLLGIADKLALTKLLPKPMTYPVKVMGLEFPNPVGLAAGYDKNAEYITPLSSLGFGYLEVGTVTPKPQVGNPQPRVHRLPEVQGLINCLGFNNKGLEYFVEQLQQSIYQGVLGISITQNNATPFTSAIADYLACLTAVYPYASYITIDVSCPNVPNKVSLEIGEPFEHLLSALKERQAALVKRYERYVPLVIKVGADFSNEELASIAGSLLKYKIDGVAAINTTKQRPNIATHPMAKYKGGLSGAPIRELALNAVRELHRHLGKQIPIIGLGGIISGEDACAMLDAGASLVQVYTGLVYHGPALIREIVSAISAR